MEDTGKQEQICFAMMHDFRTLQEQLLRTIRSTEYCKDEYCTAEEKAEEIRGRI